MDNALNNALAVKERAIDLTAQAPSQTGQQAQRRQNNNSKRGQGFIELGSSDEEDDKRQRQRIMSYAASVNAKNGLGGNASPGGACGKRGRPQPVPSASHAIVISSDEEGDMDMSPQAMHKRRKVQHAGSFGAMPPHGNERTSAAAHAATSAQQQPAEGASLMATLAREREERQRMRQQQQQQQQQHAAEPAMRTYPRPCAMPQPGSMPSTSAAQSAAVPHLAGLSIRPEVSILTYNVWFKEELMLQERMQGIGAVIEACGLPDFILLQEVTRNIVSLLSAMPWWQRYASSVPPLPPQSYFNVLCARRDTVRMDAPIATSAFPNSCMGRGMLYARTSVHGLPLLVATAHLESPVPPRFFSEERMLQQRKATEVLDTLGTSGGADVVFAGDFNWTDTRDGPLHLLPGWRDVWEQLRPGETGLTYDTKANPMLEGSWAGSRLDRVLCRLGTSFEPVSVEMVGQQALPGVRYVSRSGRSLPVLPSDHFGLLFKMRVKPGVQAQVQAPAAAAAAAGLLPFMGSGHRLGAS